ncbi:MAG: formylglycine-generating enzyme family protein, partial [Roseibacillus sp.]|nr:formylglycine-generating enzyme family protein [Roseibacillus sp.]
MKRLKHILKTVSLLVALPSLAEEPATGKQPVVKAPAKFTNSTPSPSQWNLPSMDRMFVSRKVHEVISKKGASSAPDALKDYEEVVARADKATYKMIALKGGEFLMGSPEGEHKLRTEDEGPQKRLRIEPFWIGQTEVPWALFKPFYENGVARTKNGFLLAEGAKQKVTVKGKQRKKALAEALARGDRNNVVDVISQPTPQYHDMFGSGEYASDLNYPAMCMTQHAASKFCQWLSAQTGHFYRLPTEAEWEYAC